LPTPLIRVVKSANAMEGKMRIDMNPLLSITSILDRSGKRVGNYLVDKSKDATEREKRDRKGDTQQDAAVFHRSEPELEASTAGETQIYVLEDADDKDLDITA
jgi:hypothetical protein